MPSFRTGTVSEILEQHPDLQRLRVVVEGEEREAVLYQRYAAAARIGDRVVLNVTATALELGSGGQDFVVWNLAHEAHDAPSGGHIMKLRYTPAQSDVLAVEAPESPHHPTVDLASSLDGVPVVCASLHSQLLPVVCAVRSVRPATRIVYVMTAGGALEIGISRTVRRLRELGWLEATVTVGDALGGDLEAVNVYSGLLGAHAVSGAEVIVVGMGPGVVGTGTSYGTSALDLGLSVNAAASLGGRPVAAVRMSEADPRERHGGLSHHVVVALDRVALAPADVPVPTGCAAIAAPLARRHRLVEIDTSSVVPALERARADGLDLSHMGRGLEDDKLFFLAAGAAGLHAARLVGEG